MLARSILIAWSLASIGGVCCAGSVSTMPRRTVNRDRSKRRMRGGAVPAIDRPDGRKRAVHDRRRAGRGAGGRPSPHRDPAASPGAPAVRVRRRASRRLLPDGRLPGLLGAARRRAAPARVRAAETLARGGVRPILFEEGERPGGQIYRQPPRGAGRAAAELYGLEAAKAAAIHRVLPDLADRVDYRPQTLVWNVFQNQLDLLGPDGYGEQRFDRLILATGAMDRALPFPGWTLPGVFTLGGAQIALKAQGVSIGWRVAFVGAGPLLPLVADQYAKAGADVVAVL